MLQQIRPAILSVLVWFALLGLVFPLGVTLLAKGLFPFQANGSLLKKEGKMVGSSLIAQAFTSPAYFHPRPSAAGSGYDPTSSGGTNLSPATSKLNNGVHGNKNPSDNFEGIKDFADAYRKENGLPNTQPLPTDAVTRSGSGLDPDISLENALLQAPRVAKARGVDVAQARRLVQEYVTPRQFGLLGEPRVNVLQLNLALDKAFPIPRKK